MPAGHHAGPEPRPVKRNRSTANHPEPHLALTLSLSRHPRSLFGTNHLGAWLLSQPWRGEPLWLHAGLVCVERADAIHIGTHVAGRRKTWSPADCARGGIDERQDDRQTALLSDPVEAGLPVLALAAGPLGSNAQQERLVPLGLDKEVADGGRRVLPVECDRPGRPEDRSKGAPEELLLDQEPELDVVVPRQQHREDPVPVGCVWRTDDHASLRERPHRLPACGSQTEAREVAAEEKMPVHFATVQRTPAGNTRLRPPQVGDGLAL